jgi:hypothetical protein
MENILEFVYSVFKCVSNAQVLFSLELKVGRFVKLSVKFYKTPKKYKTECPTFTVKFYKSPNF